MKLKPSKNWIAKLLSLLVAAAIWFLIKAHLAETASRPPEPTVAPSQVKKPARR